MLNLLFISLDVKNIDLILINHVHPEMFSAFLGKQLKEYSRKTIEEV